MPLLLAVPLSVLVFVVLMLALLPLSLWQRFRGGSVRRQAWPWWVALNAWSTLASSVLFAVFVAIASLWWPGVWWHACVGLAIGLALSGLGMALTRFEATPGPLYYTPSPWLALGLTALVLARIIAGMVQGWRSTVGGQPWPVDGWLGHGSLLGAAALLLGYALGYAWMLRRRLRHHQRYRGYDRSPR